MPLVLAQAPLPLARRTLTLHVPTRTLQTSGTRRRALAIRVPARHLARRPL